MLDIKEVGRRIRALRMQKGMTQREFSEALQVSFQAVSNWERGIAPPELENLLRMSECFCVSVDELVRPHEKGLALGIDGGGTKTEFAVVSREGTVKKLFYKKGSNPNDLGFEASVDLIAEGIREALAGYPALESVFCGVAGMGAGDYRLRSQRELKERFPSLPIEVQTDAVNLLACEEQADMVLIGGTGSVVYLREKEGYRRLGGWGYLLDPAGSAYDIGRDALACVLAEEEAKEEASLLALRLRERLGVTALWEAVGTVYAEGRAFVASLAPTVIAACEEGDSKALAIVTKSVRRLAELLELGVRVYGARPCAVAGGGLFSHHGALLQELMAPFTSVRLLISTLPPVYGACRSAFQGETGEEFYRNFQESYGGKKQ